jgi:ABC-type transport system involved in cytochrome bd biosynthesis fused ATPase/permease subunit
MITKSDTSLIIVTAFIIMRSLPAVQVLWNASNQINSSKHIYIKLLKVIKSSNNFIDDPYFSLISENSNHDLIKINEIQLDINEFKLKIPSISLKKGDRIRLSGESGSGKTTFIDLLAGLYPFFTSNINTNLTKKRIKTEYCTQSIQLAHGTILSNLIPYSIEPPSLDELNKVYRLLDKLNLTRTINDFGGFEMIVGRNNNPFSGGELKRFGIAKSLMSKADLYIFDEPEQGLDSINISNVYDEIFKLKSAVIIVSHNEFRLSDFNIKLNVQNGIVTSVN